MDKSLAINKIKKHIGVRYDKEFADFLGIKPTTLSMWHKRNTFDIELLFTKCDFLNPSWLITGKGDMIKTNEEPTSTKPNIQHKTNPQKNIPLIPTDAFAGFGGGVVSIMEQDIMERYSVPDFTNVDFMIRIKGSSMYPKYNSGDVVACKMINSESFLQWNKVHVIATKEQGVLIKRLKKSSEEGFITAISDNKDYDPFDIPKDEILNIALVTGVIRLE